jgi:hypothetical protein
MFGQKTPAAPIIVLGAGESTTYGTMLREYNEIKIKSKTQGIDG